jgi:sterol desaturase/sphingolipid hydroxylase (fatty acid hydroxylase superfamily)
MKAVPVDASIFVVMYLGFIADVPWALNVSLFFLWLCAVLYIFGSFAWKTVVEQMNEMIRARKKVEFRSRAWQTYDVATDTIALGIIAATGWFVLATVYLIGLLLFKSEIYAWASGRASY